MPIPMPPTPPSSADPENFNARADAFMQYFPTLVTYLNALGTPGLGGGDMLGDLGLAPDVTVASAATTDISAVASNKVTISGTASITSLGTTNANRLKFIRFSGAATLVPGANLILPGGANIVTAVNDTCIAISSNTGVWRIYSYTRAAVPPAREVSGSFSPVTIASTPAYTAAAAFSVPVPGAAIGDFVVAISSSASMAGLVLLGSVIAADTVQVSPFNPTSAAVDPANGQTVTVIVRKAT